MAVLLDALGRRLAKRGDLFPQRKCRAGKLPAREDGVIPNRLAVDDRVEVVGQGLAEGSIRGRLGAGSPALVGKFVEEEAGQLVILMGNALGQVGGF